MNDSIASMKNVGSNIMYVRKLQCTIHCTLFFFSSIVHCTLYNTLHMKLDLHSGAVKAESRFFRLLLNDRP